MLYILCIYSNSLFGNLCTSIALCLPLKFYGLFSYYLEQFYVSLVENVPLQNRLEITYFLPFFMNISYIVENYYFLFRWPEFSRSH